MKLFVKAIAALAVAASPAVAVADVEWSDEVMRIQADAFLENMPDGLQTRQGEAIVKAIAGDNAVLEGVRNSRNTPPVISENVRMRELTGTMRLYEPVEETGEDLPALVYLHGGGWTIGSLNSCGRYCNAMAATGKMKVIAVDYRLAPENPYPCGLIDCVWAIGYVYDNASSLGIDSSRVTVGGDSSGGNLAIASALHPFCRGKVESVVAYYPVTKAFDDGTVSWNNYGAGYALDAQLMNLFNRAYYHKIPSDMPLIDVGMRNPVELRELMPRTLLVAAGRDILRDQGKEFAEILGADKVTRVEFPEAVHLFITVPGQDEAFGAAVSLAAEFIVKNSR